MIFHIIAFITGYILDLIIGDPHWFYHPVRLIGKLISKLEKYFLREFDTETAVETDVIDSKTLRRRGILTVVIVCLATLVITGELVIFAYYVNQHVGIIVEVLLTYMILATKSLRVESMAVYKKLETGTIEDARRQVSMIVGRDTKSLDAAHVAMAAVETVAENTSDGVIAPMIYTAIGGPILGFLYKAINTMDSMIGYKNDRYLDYGRAAAKLDDIVNYLPARISAFLMIIAAGICGIFSSKYSMRDAYRIFRRDRFNHSSPNSAQTESACAGALGLRLAGDASYFGKIVHKPFIGDNLRPIETEDIKRANVLMYMTAFLCLIVCVAVMLVVYSLVY